MCGKHFYKLNIVKTCEKDDELIYADEGNIYHIYCLKPSDVTAWLISISKDKLQ